jgi:hypothetical protein
MDKKRTDEPKCYFIHNNYAWCCIFQLPKRRNQEVSKITPSSINTSATLDLLSYFPPIGAKIFSEHQK